MQNQTYSFSCFNDYASQGISSALTTIPKLTQPPILLCIGSDKVLGDSLGPLIGTMLKQKNNAFVYGSLSFPITAKEINYAKTYLKATHPNSPVIAIDAAVGEDSEIGIIRVLNHGIKPGLGVNKNLCTVGDCSIIGIVAKKEKDTFTLLNTTRLNLIYKMANQITTGIESYLNTSNR